MPRAYSYLPQPPQELMASHPPSVREGKKKGADAEAEAVRTFPANVQFVVADWAKDGIEEDRKAYDIIFA